MIIDASNNIYITGSFYGAVDFDPGVDTYDFTSVGYGDIFTSKFDSSGNFVWAKSMGGVGSGNGSSIILDSSENIYIAGGFNDTTDFDPGEGIYNIVSIGDDIFFSKLSLLFSSDTTPAVFSLADQTGMSLSTPTESNTITISGINALTPISISTCTSISCEYKINNGSYTSSAGTVEDGDTVIVRQTSSNAEMTATNLVLDIGGVTDTFTITTGDFTNPEITLTGESTITIYKGENYNDQGATAVDNIDGDITGDIVTVNPVDTNIINEYTVTYNVNDASENHATEVIRTVIVKKRSSTTGSSVSAQYVSSNPQAMPVVSPNPTIEPIIKDDSMRENISGEQTPLFTRILKYKMTGDDVRALQVYLNTHNFTVSLTGLGSLGNETTYFGLKTRQAVIKFQLANHLTPDGVVGKMTKEKMM